MDNIAYIFCGVKRQILCYTLRAIHSPQRSQSLQGKILLCFSAVRGKTITRQIECSCGLFQHEGKLKGCFAAALSLKTPLCVFLLFSLTEVIL